MIDALTMGIRFLYEIMRASVRWSGMTPSHRKELIKALNSDVGRGQWVAGMLSKADSKTTTSSQAEQLIITSKK